MEPSETGVRNWDLENQALSAKMTCTNCKYQFRVVVMLFRLSQIAFRVGKKRHRVLCEHS